MLRKSTATAVWDTRSRQVIPGSVTGGLSRLLTILVNVRSASADSWTVPGDPGPAGH
jgi:hypothetical protein